MKVVHIRENVDLKTYSVMRLGGKARHLAEVHKQDELAKLVGWAKKHGLPFLMIGEGANIVWRDEGYKGLVIVNRIKGRRLLAKDSQSVTVKLGGGEDWDECVAWTVEQGLSGVEFLSMIPGTVGAGPVQNIGAYGAELSNVLIELEAYDEQAGRFVSLSNHECDFAYRTSRFKTADKGRFMITSVSLKLSKNPPQPPFYEALESYFKEHDVSEFNPATIRQAVIAIRTFKLPDPSLVANNGSFFTNPIVGLAKFGDLKQKYPDIKAWPHKGGKVKIAAGWLVETAGFKPGTHDKPTGMATWKNHALVLVNEHAHSTADLLAFKQKIVDKVDEMFGITLAQEPELLP